MSLNYKYDFNFSIDNKGHKGNIDIKRISLGLVPINNIPLVIKKGNIKITGKDILLNDFVGFIFASLNYN